MLRPRNPPNPPGHLRRPQPRRGNAFLNPLPIHRIPAAPARRQSIGQNALCRRHSLQAPINNKGVAETSVACAPCTLLARLCATRIFVKRVFDTRIFAIRGSHLDSPPAARRPCGVGMVCFIPDDGLLQNGLAACGLFPRLANVLIVSETFSIHDGTENSLRYAGARCFASAHGEAAPGQLPHRSIFRCAAGLRSISQLSRCRRVSDFSPPCCRNH